MTTTNTQLLHVTQFANLTRWSAHNSVFENADNHFPLVPLLKVLKRVKEPISIENDQCYKRITVRLYGQGVLQRDEVQGKEIRTKRQFTAHAGQLIISRIDARNGAFGVVPNELEGAIVTNDFWLFEVENALPEYLMLILSSDLFQKYWQTQSSGTTNRQRISEDAFLNSRIALPTTNIQSEIVNKYLSDIKRASLYETHARNIIDDINFYLFDELGIKEKQIESSGNAIKLIDFSSLYQWGYDKNSVSFPYTFEKFKAFSFANKPTWIKAFLRGKSPQYSTTCTSIILNQKCNRTDYIDLSFAKTVDTNWLRKLNNDYLTKKNDILINSTGEGTLGRASIITDEFEGLAYDSHMLLLRVNSDEVDAQLIVDLLNSPFGQRQVEFYKSAQATKQTELGIENTKKFLFPLPNLSEQKRISSSIEEKKQETTELLKKAEVLRQQAKREFETKVFG